MKFFTSALTRQITEAVWISRWGEDSLLNSKGEYNRCKIGRLPWEMKGTEKWINLERRKLQERM